MLDFLRKITTFLQQQNIHQSAQFEKSGAFFEQKGIFFSNNPLLIFSECNQLKNSGVRRYKH